MKNTKDEVLDHLNLKMESSYDQTSSSTFGKYVAIVSFLIGTLLISLALLAPNSGIILLIGFAYVIGALFYNLIIFIDLLLGGKTPVEKHVNRKMAVKMLLNIPVAFVYFRLIISF